MPQVHNHTTTQHLLTWFDFSHSEFTPRPHSLWCHVIVRMTPKRTGQRGRIEAVVMAGRSDVEPLQQPHDRQGGRCCIERQTTSDTSLAESCHHCYQVPWSSPHACPPRALTGTRNFDFRVREYCMHSTENAASQTDGRTASGSLISSSWRFHHHGSKRQTRSSFSPIRLIVSVAWNILSAASASRVKTPVDGRGSSEEAQRRQRRSRTSNDPHSPACTLATRERNPNSRLGKSPDSANYL